MTLSRRIQFGMISENSYDSGTDGTNDLTAGADPSDWFGIIEEGEPPFRNGDGDQRITDEINTAVHSTRADQVYRNRTEVAFEFPITGKKSSAGDPPHWDHILQAANFEETINGTTDSNYSPVTGDDISKVPSMAAVCYIFTEDQTDAYRWVVTGIRGNITWTFEMGEEARGSFEGAGTFANFPRNLHVADNGNTLPTKPTDYSGDKDALRVIGMTFTVDSTNYDIESAEIETGWNLREKNVGTKADRTLQELTLERATDSPVGGSLTLRADSSVLKDIFSEIDSGATSSMTITLSDGTDTVDFSFPAVQFGTDTVSMQEATFANPFFARGDYGNTSGEDELTITFT